MGSKNGKYDFKHGGVLPDGQGTLPTSAGDEREASSDRQTKCTHRDSLVDPFLSAADHVSLVWLDTDIHRRASNIDTEVKLKNLVRYVRVFDRVDACERYIKQIGKMNANSTGRNEYLLVLISTALAPTLIPHLHDLPQVKHVYVYGKSNSMSKAHQEWIKRNSKVRRTCEQV